MWGGSKFVWGVPAPPPSTQLPRNNLENDFHDPGAQTTAPAARLRGGYVFLELLSGTRRQSPEHGSQKYVRVYPIPEGKGAKISNSGAKIHDCILVF